ncbi:MAG: putative membrane protein [Planctomycetota bacterium]|jgi:uncharacterized membrane protein
MRNLRETGAIFLCLSALNFLFHQVVAGRFLDEQLDGITKPLAELGPIGPGLIYLLSAVIIVICARVAQGQADRRLYAVASGGAVGLLSFGTWNVINFGLLPDWPLSVVIVDTAWHVLAGVIAGFVLVLVFPIKQD